MRKLYIALALTTIASRVFTLAANISREAHQRKMRKQYELDRLGKTVRTIPTDYVEQIPTESRKRALPTRHRAWGRF